MDKRLTHLEAERKIREKLEREEREKDNFNINKAILGLTIISLAATIRLLKKASKVVE